MRRTVYLVPIILMAAGCASNTAKTARYAAGKQDLRGAVTQPLEDFNIIRDKIPPTLKKAQAAPYAKPAPYDCTGIHTEVSQLDEVLGPDADVTDPAPSGRSAQGAAMVTKSAIGVVRDITTDWIPLRSWVRMLTGAERNSDAVRKAVNAGMMRRAYLKGLAQSEACPITAAAPPQQFPAPPQTPSSAGG